MIAYLPYKRCLIDNISIQMFTQALNVKNPFAFLRLGDTEWRSILELPWACKEHDWAAGISEYLRMLIEDKKYTESGMIYSLPYHVIKMFGSKIEDFAKERGLDKLAWRDADIFCREAKKGDLYGFFKALSNRRTFLVGPKHLEDLKFLHSGGMFIIPDRNAWSVKGEAVESLRERVKPDDVVIACGSVMAKFVVAEIWTEKRVTALDLGSLFDVFVEKPSRTYQKNISEDRIKRCLRNLQ